jgi:hypothetical protein
MSTSRRKIHPIRGLFAGLLFGLGLSVILVSYSVIAFGTNAPLIIVLVCVVLGALWGSFGPARGGTEST